MTGELVMLTGGLFGIVAVLLLVARDPGEPFGHVVTCTGIVTRKLDTERCDKCRWLAERGEAWRS